MWATEEKRGDDGEGREMDGGDIGTDSEATDVGGCSPDRSVRIATLN